MGKTIFKLLFGFIYTVGYFFPALLSTGGHGNFYVLLPLIPWLLLFVPIFLFEKFNESANRIIFILVLLLHYGIQIVFLSGYDFARVRGWTKNYFPYPVVIWYAAGQLIVWTQFFNEIFIEKRKAE
jgi:hypothetical protein